MRVANMMKPNGRVFLKSEWGQISSDWPCVSFSKRSVWEHLRSDFVPERDVLIYVGTTNPETTPRREHRSCLVSAVIVEPSQMLETHEIVPPEIWESTKKRWGDHRWPHSVAVTFAANMTGPPYPNARKLVRDTYKSLSEMANRGRIVEAKGTERKAVMGLRIEPITLALREGVKEYIELRRSMSPDIPTLIRQEAHRMAELIINRVKKSGESGIRINPQRSTPDYKKVYPLLVQKWLKQNGLCALCNGKLGSSQDGPLKPSPDRIESDKAEYNDANVQITHLACNLAKNEYGTEDFKRWLSVVRGG